MIAVDAAPSMVEQARALLPADVDVRRADLLELALDDPVDAVLSTATFHWIGDHERLFANLHGRCGRAAGWSRSAAATATWRRSSGPGSKRRHGREFAAHFEGWAPDWNFATPEDTERRLLAAGFTSVWCWPTRVDVDPGDPAGYLGAICLGSFLARLPEELHEPFVAAALERLPEPLTIHYVRLNILARAGGEGSRTTPPA